MTVTICVDILQNGESFDFRLDENDIEFDDSLESVQQNLSGMLFMTFEWKSKNGAYGIKVHPDIKMSFKEQRILEKIGVLKPENGISKS